MVYLTSITIFPQIYDKNVILQYILDTVNKTNMIDYTMDIRQRLNLGESMPNVSTFIQFINPSGLRSIMNHPVLISRSWQPVVWKFWPA